MANPEKVMVGLGVILLKEGKILLGKRHEDPEKADSELHGEGTWTLPGGKLEYQETLEECASREVMEETSIELKNSEVICVANDKNPHAHFITIGLISEDFEGDAKVMEPDEITEWEWFPINGLPENMFFPSSRTIRNYKANKFYIPD